MRIFHNNNTYVLCHRSAKTDHVWESEHNNYIMHNKDYNQGGVEKENSDRNNEENDNHV